MSVQTNILLSIHDKNMSRISCIGCIYVLLNIFIQEQTNNSTLNTSHEGNKRDLDGDSSHI
jgi:hypothetical protein